MLLRYFVNFYDMEIIEEEAFLAWKEDITQEFPGKGKALFQVRFHMNRLETHSTGILFIFELLSSALHKKKRFYLSTVSPPLR